MCNSVALGNLTWHALRGRGSHRNWVCGLEVGCDLPCLLAFAPLSTPNLCGERISLLVGEDVRRIGKPQTSRQHQTCRLRTVAAEHWRTHARRSRFAHGTGRRDETFLQVLVVLGECCGQGCGPHQGISRSTAWPPSVSAADAPRAHFIPRVPVYHPRHCVLAGMVTLCEQLPKA